MFFATIMGKNLRKRFILFRISLLETHLTKLNESMIVTRNFIDNYFSMGHAKLSTLYTLQVYIDRDKNNSNKKNRGSKKKKKCGGSRCHTADDLLLSRGLQHD